MGWRDIVDVECYVRFRFRRTEDREAGNETRLAIYVPTNSQGDRSNSIGALKRHKFHTFSLNIRKVPELTTNVAFSGEFRKRAEAGSLSLQEIMNHFDETEMCVEILGYDRFSGARRYFEHTYRAADVEPGTFERLTFIPSISRSG